MIMFRFRSSWSAAVTAAALITSMTGCGPGEPLTDREQAERAQENLEQVREDAAETIAEAEEEAAEVVAEAEEEAVDMVGQAKEETRTNVREARRNFEEKLDQLAKPPEPEPVPQIPAEPEPEPAPDAGNQQTP